MTQVLVIGCGKSSSVLIDYLLEQAEEHDWHVLAVDRDAELAHRRIAGHPHGEAGAFELADEEKLDELVRGADLVVSMLPASLHPPVAVACLRHRKHFVTASYVSEEVRALHQAAERAGVTLLNEMGVDPGIDHMSAMEKLDAIRGGGARVRGFETFTGGLVAPESDDNPWHYKFTWNPRNVVLAGQGGVKFKHCGRFKYIPYHNLFRRYERLEIPGHGEFEGYPNRDSLRYRGHYQLEEVETIYRGTLRRPGFCDAWHCLVSLGLTDDSYELDGLEGMTYRDFINAFLWFDQEMSVELKVRAYLKLELNSSAFDRLEWLGIFERRPIGLSRATPAQVLQKLLEERWAFGEQDKDMIAMLHKVDYEAEGVRFRQQSSMVTLGDDAVHTAMAKTVGLTAGIGAKLVLEGKIARRGVVIPTAEEVYRPVLSALRERGVAFVEQEPQRVDQHEKRSP